MKFLWSLYILLISNCFSPIYSRVISLKFNNMLKEIMLGILPVILIITILQFTIAPVEMELYIRFLWSNIFVIIGLFLFLIGIEYGFQRAGENIGRAIVKSGKLSWILFVTTLLGFGVTLLEPDVQVFAEQAASIVDRIDAFELAVVIAIGVGLFVGVAFLKIFLNVPIKYILLGGYLLAFILVAICPAELSSVAFDAGGATTGALTVPFLLSLSMGVSSMISKNKDSSGSFGIIGIASLGPILSILIMGVIAR